jgi:hypothetical protein
MPTLPTDHKPKIGFARLGTKNYPVRPGLDDDWDFADLLAAAEDGSPAATVRAVKYALMDDADAYAALRKQATVDGRVSATKVGEIFERIIEQSAPNS